MAKFLILLSAIVLGVLSRWLPHPPNFTPIIAIAIFMGMRLQNTWSVLLMPVLILFVSDIFLGFDSTAIIIYPSLMSLALFVLYTTKKKIFSSKSLEVVSLSLGGSIWFFLLSNGAVWWFSGMYTKNWNGLIASYFAGVPFFNNTLISTLVFTSALVLADKLIFRWAYPTILKSRY
ncbi:MAG: hypothetical protein H6625_03020 [Bdellovibrionaceae bacterium]|nr:hypothetical protein [Pseudobdellovibrionaceae bacterium]